MSNKVVRAESGLRFRNNRGNHCLQLSIQKISNGYTLRAGAAPVYFPSLRVLSDTLATELRRLEENMDTTKEQVE